MNSRRFIARSLRSLELVGWIQHELSHDRQWDVGRLVRCLWRDREQESSRVLRATARAGIAGRETREPCFAVELHARQAAVHGAHEAELPRLFIVLGTVRRRD